MTIRKTFYTYDIGIASALISKGFQIEHIDKKNPKKACFKFHADESISKTVELYWKDQLPINTRTLLDNLKMLKNRLYSQDV